MAVTGDIVCVKWTRNAEIASRRILELLKLDVLRSMMRWLVTEYNAGISRGILSVLLPQTVLNMTWKDTYYFEQENS